MIGQNKEKILDDLVKMSIAKQDEVIIGIMRESGIEGVDMRHIVRHIGASGTEDWKYKNKTFARVFPFKASQVTDGKTVKVILTQTIEKINFLLEA